MTNIRLATIKDIDGIVEFRRQGNREGEYINNRPAEKIKEDIVSLEYIYYIALRGHAVVGQIMLRKLTTRNILFVAHLAILDSEKGSGLAVKLMDIAKSEMLESNFTALELIVSSKNERAVKFYEKYGFNFQSKSGKYGLVYRYRNIAMESFCLLSLW